MLIKYENNNLFPLTNDILSKEIASRLTGTELKNLTEISKTGYGLFQSELPIRFLLEYIAKGEQIKAQRLITQQPELFLKYGNVMDYSGRIFSNISAWQLMRWYFDTRHMGNMMLDCLPRDSRGEAIRLQIQQQDAQFEQSGVSYILEGQTFQNAGFDFFPLIKAYEEYIKNSRLWDNSTCVMHWCTRIGKEQFYLPVHVAQHYCDSKIPFYPTPSFQEKELVRNLSFFDLSTSKDQNFWCKDMSGEKFLGTSFGILRGKSIVPKRLIRSWGEQEIDLAAILNLSQVRSTTDLTALKERLSSSIKPINAEKYSGSASFIKYS